ncbi:60S acidic ribosomal protein P1, partial [Perkinsus olseni]
VKYYGKYLDAQKVKETKNRPGIPHMPKYNFRTVEEAQSLVPGSIVDVQGVILTCTDVTTVHIAETDKRKSKRNFSLIDQTGAVQVTAWEEQATSSKVTPELASSNPIVALKSARVVEFEGGTLTIGPHTIIQVYPESSWADIENLKDWWEAQTARDSKQDVIDLDSTHD